MWCALVRPGSVARVRHPRRRVLRRRGPHFPPVVPNQWRPDFPLGLGGGLVLAYWSHDIDTKVGRESLFVVTAILCVLATIVRAAPPVKSDTALTSRETLIRNPTY